MESSPLIDAILELCASRGLPVARDVKVGCYLAPLLVTAHDAHGLGRNLRIALEPRHWPPSVALRMAQWAETHRERLRKLTAVEFVAIVVEAPDTAPAGLTSLRELADFLDGFTPPQEAPATAAAPVRFRQAPVATHAYEQALAGHLGTWTGGGVVFCAMPFAPEFDPVFFELIAPAVADAGLTVMRTDQEETLERIDRRIHEGIRQADLVLGEVTGHNPNVMYEIGLAHALNKQTLLLRQDTLAPPFDIRYYEIMDYAMARRVEARARLAARLAEAARSLWGG